MTEKKKPVKLGSWCRLSNPTREQSTAKPRRDPPYKKVCASKPCWRINCEVVLLTVLNILNYSKSCYAKNMCGWTFTACARHRPTVSGYQKKSLSRRNMKKKYMISCGSTSWVGWIRWEWKYGRHCAIIDILLSFSTPASLLFSLCSPLAPFSAHLNAWNRPVLTMKILHWVIGGDKRSLQIILGQRCSINCI